MANRSEDQGYIKNTLLIVAALAFLGTATLAISTFTAGYMSTAIGLGVGSITSVALFALTIRGNLALPRWALPPVTLIITTYLVLVGEGMRDEGILGFTLVIALAGLLLGRQWTLIYTGIAIGVISLIGIAQLSNWGFLASKPEFSDSRILVINILIAFLGALIFVIIGNLEHILKQIRQSETELATSNQALSSIQANLESIISERVRSLEEARQDADTARKSLESKAWQTAGLTNLSDVMRGDQDIHSLAERVLQQLCDYLVAQAGALFLVEDSMLVLLSSYAYQPTESDQARPIEGLIGQAVEEKRVIQISDIPGDFLHISTGLGDIKPGRITILPCLFNGEVIGVIELATAAPNPQDTGDFLDQAADRIGVAFHTAQTRGRINQLLRQAQSQAEELVVQEEELRSANEELEAQAENLRLINLQLQARKEQSS